jgi:hypothetical protein
VILKWVHLIGNRWKKTTEIVAPRFGLREGAQIKHGEKFLLECLPNAMLMKDGEIAHFDEEQEEREEVPFTRRNFLMVPRFAVLCRHLSFL